MKMRSMLFGFCLSIASFSLLANVFSVGDTVFVGIPSTTIKEDAFIVGTVSRRLDNGDYQIQVQDYVKGHDYGAFCQPVAVGNGDSHYGKGWELWQDTRQLDQKGLEFIVAQERVRPYREAQHEYIERNNNWVVFGRWLSDAPILPVERLRRAQADGQSIGLEQMADAYDLAIAHRYAFYEDGWGRPYWPYETVTRINQYLDQIITLFKQDPDLEAHWRSKPRDKAEIKQSMRTYFLILAIDKLVDDAFDQLYEKLDEADPKAVEAMTGKLEALGRPKI
ncbi:MAG: hypothetical protein RBS36_04805 [Thiomicrospira sp.]|jgi:hypothetical protein|nr:hypothetical protein [Thiomicrospira sp.]